MDIAQNWVSPVPIKKPMDDLFINVAIHENDVNIQYGLANDCILSIVGIIEQSLGNAFVVVVGTKNPNIAGINVNMVPITPTFIFK